jgi:hypothetical protein
MAWCEGRHDLKVFKVFKDIKGIKGDAIPA